MTQWNDRKNTAPGSKPMILINPNSGINRDLPNLGLAYIATIKDSKVIDLNTKREPKERYLKETDNEVLISIRSSALNESKIIRKEYKKKHKNARIRSVTGVIDVQCCYPNIGFEKNIVIKNEFNDKLAFPKYELFDSFDLFKKHWANGTWAYPVMTSLGCPFQCIYCASRNRPVKYRSPENCYEEIKSAIEKYGIKSFQIIDDCFNVNNNRVLEFCKLVKPLGLKWFCTNGLRADLFNEAQAKAISESGCKQISFGIESLDKKVLINIKKGLSVEKFKESIRIAKRYFDVVNCYFIIGLPGSTYESDLKNVNWVKSAGVNGHFSYFVPPEMETRADYTFYGDKAVPRSKEYPIELQEKIYKMTQSMRPYSIKHLVRRVIRKLSKLV
ncbi:MAG TPA: radical SAM protein [Candidatus Nanoarchaeia archaeon]|nr:radical SAM protein [Candidatus Nanoarchaeia archaeon]